MSTILWMIGVVFFAYFLSLFDIFFTQMKEGRFTIIKTGDRVSRFLMAVQGKGIDAKTGAVKSVEDDAKEKQKTDWKSLMSWLSRKTGMTFIGIPGFVRLMTYTLRHKEFVTTEENGVMRVNEMKECVRIYKHPPYRDSHAILVPATETKGDRFDPDLYLLITTEVTNAYKAYVLTLDYAMNLESTVQAGCRQYAGNHGYTSLLEAISEKTKSQNAPSNQDTAETKKAKVAGLMEIVTNLATLEELYGQKIIDVDIRQVVLPRDIREILQAEGRAKQQAKALVVTAKAKGKEAQLVGEGKAAGYAAQLEAAGGDPELLERLATADAVKETRVEVLSMGPSIIPTANTYNRRGRRRDNRPDDRHTDKNTDRS